MTKYYKCTGYTDHPGCTQKFIIGKIYKCENGTMYCDPERGNICWSVHKPEVLNIDVSKYGLVKLKQDPITWLKTWYCFEEVEVFNSLLR